MRLEPQLPSLDHRIDSHLQPPHRFVAAAMNLAMVSSTQRYGEFVADLAAECWALRKPQVVGIRWLPGANQAGLLGNELDVVPIANPARFWKSELAFVDRLGPLLPIRSGRIARRTRD
jgi:hypothetical protein